MTKARTNASVAPAVGRNMVINGAMNVAQRGTSFTGIGASSGYSGPIDRFRLSAGSTAGRLTASQTADGPNGISANCLKLDCTTADTNIAAGEKLIIEQRFEGQNLQRIGKGVAGAKQVTVSFYVKASAAFDFALEVFDNDHGRGCSKLFSTTTDWVRQELTFPADVDDGSSPFGDDNASSVRLFFWLHSGSTFTSGTLQSGSFANATNGNRAAGIDSFFSNDANNFFLTGVQMEVGPVATEFEQKDFGTELLLCKRYYNKVANGTGVRITSGGYFSTSGFQAPIVFPVEMRSAPTLEIGTGTNYFVINANAADTINDLAIDGAKTKSCSVFNNDEASGTAGFSGMLSTNNSSAYLAFIAEL